MQVSVLRRNGRSLSQGAAVLLVAGMAAGCSSQVARFGGGGVDGIFTASTPNQRQIIPQGDQPYPAETQVAAAPVDGSHSSSVTRGALAPVVDRAGFFANPSAPHPLPPCSRSTTPRPAPCTSSRPWPSEEGDPKGWSRAGGTQVTVKEGETVYNLSRRFGVPADVIMKANGLSESDGLKAGAKVVIPTYVYSNKAPVSAPDNNPKTATAKSSRGENLPADPAKKPGENVAVLPQPPKLKEGEAAPQATTADGSHAKPAGAPGTYKVQDGDTLSRIAKKTGVSTASLKQANGLDDGLIRIGQTLKIPSAGGTKVAAASTHRSGCHRGHRPGQEGQGRRGRRLYAAEEGRKSHRAGRGRRYGGTQLHRHRPHALAGARAGSSRNMAAATANRATASTSRCRRERRSRPPRTASSSMPATGSRNSATRFWCGTKTAWSRSTAMPAS